jgi:hypothetical protein
VVVLIDRSKIKPAIMNWKTKFSSPRVDKLANDLGVPVQELLDYIADNKANFYTMNRKYGLYVIDFVEDPNDHYYKAKRKKPRL